VVRWLTLTLTHQQEEPVSARYCKGWRRRCKADPQRARSEKAAR